MEFSELYLYVRDWTVPNLNMEPERSQPLPIPKTPKKRSPVKRQASVLWEQNELQEHTRDEHILQVVSQLQKRLSLLENERQELLEHLSQQEDSEELTQ